MDSIVELVKRNEQLLLENAEALNDEEVEQEDIDEYLKIQGATKEELSAFENQFQIRLPEDFKTVYSYKNGSGYMSFSCNIPSNPNILARILGLTESRNCSTGTSPFFFICYQFKFCHIISFVNIIWHIYHNVNYPFKVTIPSYFSKNV